MSRPYYDHGYGGGMPEYRFYNEPPRQRQNVQPQSRIPRPGFPTPDRMRGPPAMGSTPPGLSPGRSPRRAPAPQQQPYHPHSDHAWQTSGNLYDGSAYDYQEDYGQNDQWPLPAPSQARPARQNSNSPRRVPQRLQRPEESPQRQQLDSSQQMREPQRSRPSVPVRQHHQAQQMSHHGSGQWTGDAYSYAPPPNYPLPSRPVPSASSSQLENLTAIPPYAPQQAAYRAQENHRPPLGPPPSARRGPSSYYPQAGPVLPIQEETDSMRGSTRTGSAHTGGHDSKTSFASSNAIPIGISQTHLDRGREMVYQPVRRPAPLSDTEDNDYDDSPTEPAIARGEFRTPEPARMREHSSPEQGIVRQASLGKRSKPTLTTVKSSEQVRKSSGDAKHGVTNLPSQQYGASRSIPSIIEDPARTERSRAMAHEMLEGQAQAGALRQKPELMVQDDQQSVDTAPAVTSAAAYMHESPVLQQQVTAKPTPEDAFRSGTALLSPSSESEKVDHHLRKQRSKELLGSELSNQLHAQRSKPRSPLASAVDPRVESIIGSLEKGGALSAEEAQELKQPMGGLSERAGRRRPPRLNVDAVKEAEARGSLTSLPDLIRRATKLASNLDRGKTASRMGMNWFDGAEADEKKRRSGSMSDILAAFPPPALATPPESRNAFRRSLAAWSTRNRHSALHSDSDAGAMKRRRCCGMPTWAFICLLLLLFMFVAAAVIVPVVLVVIPNQEDATTTKVGSCAAKSNCENGGTNIMSSDGNCVCLCINGYTGSTCTTFRRSGCTSLSVGSSTNATIGEAIPRLLSSATKDFNIPLDSQELLGLFSRSEMNCNVQNQLMTFNGLNRKRLSQRTVISLTAPFELHKRQGTSDDPTATDSGILYALATPTTSSSPPAEVSSTSSTAETSQTALDFARVTVLYIFQLSRDLHTAADAQEHLQAYFRSGAGPSGQLADSRNLTLGGSYSINLNDLMLSVPDGTTVGATDN
ncbi:Putative EGF-like domain-containing protein [Septoria linicola]|uniref:EGF-like domain-containing protein n=1 Tax=Septoria linicola TaxID=215465 RepID=A0A9Q9APV2_9PEZI|nr:putative EGF-like domain-containing protein [Septoria linicola]USW50933.1 Putative EGF-like domain-containing protein [Septoria linicola]